jgi:membrane-associated phospholipid phosphatase
VLDPIVIAAGVGLVASPIAGRAVLRLPERQRRAATWIIVAGALAAIVVAELWLDGRIKEGVYTFLLGALPGTVVYILWRTALASAIVCLVPLYFGIGARTLGRPLHAPALPLDAMLPLQPVWMLVYGSLYLFALLPLLVVRDGELLRRAMKSYVLVMLVAYAGFIAYPTVAPHTDEVIGSGFAMWSLRLVYEMDQPYNCFPSLHVAHSFVSAFACYRVHKGVGGIALFWASLVGLSTLFTKQHYVVDVIGGAVSAYAAYLLFLRGFPRHLIAEDTRRLAPRRALWVAAAYALTIACFWIAYLITGTIPADHPDARNRVPAQQAFHQHR